MMHNTEISIVIPCLNEAGVVNDLLDQLIAQKLDVYEIIAVDNSSNDATLEILKQYESEGVVVVGGVPRGVSRARNAGAKKARGKWLLFLDADNQIPENFMLEILKVAKGNDVDIAAVAYKAKTKNLGFKFLTWCGQKYQRLSSKYGKVPIVPGAFTLVKRSLHDSVGGYDESMTHSEDFDYSRRIHKIGAKYVAIKKPFVYFSTRRLENGGWHKMIKVYIKSELYRMRGKDYHPKEYDLSDHKMH